MTDSPMSATQVEILEYLFHGYFIEIEPSEFPYAYALRRKSRKGGIHYTAAPVLGLASRGLIAYDAENDRYVISPEGEQVASIR